MSGCTRTTIVKSQSFYLAYNSFRVVIIVVVVVLRTTSVQYAARSCSDTGTSTAGPQGAGVGATWPYPGGTLLVAPIPGPVGGQFQRHTCLCGRIVVVISGRY